MTLYQEVLDMAKRTWGHPGIYLPQHLREHSALLLGRDGDSNIVIHISFFVIVGIAMVAPGSSMDWSPDLHSIAWPGVRE